MCLVRTYFVGSRPQVTNKNISISSAGISLYHVNVSYVATDHILDCCFFEFTDLPSRKYELKSSIQQIKIEKAAVKMTKIASLSKREILISRVITVGIEEGMVEGETEGMVEGEREGMVEGEREGMVEGEREGLEVGDREGLVEVKKMGLVEGDSEELSDGDWVG